MAIQTVTPLVNTTPDQGGSSPVSGISNTGHTTTATGASAVDFGPGSGQNNTTTKTAKWSSFGSFPAGTINSLHLKLNWDIVGDVAVETGVDAPSSGEAHITFTIEYSLDGGSSWLPGISRTRSALASDGGSDSDSIDDSGAIDVTLLTSQNIALVQVRDSMVSNAIANATSPATATASASQTTFITDIKLEADITLPPPSTNRKQVINFF